MPVFDEHDTVSVYPGDGAAANGTVVSQAGYVPAANDMNGVSAFIATHHFNWAGSDNVLQSTISNNCLQPNKNVRYSKKLMIKDRAPPSRRALTFPAS